MSRWPRLRNDGGMATVELAAALPVLMILVFAGLYGVQVSDARVRCADAARAVARAAARGDDRAVELGQTAVSGRGQISLAYQGDLVTATVSVRVRPVGIELAEATVTERATAALEPTAAVGSQALRTVRGPAQQVPT